MQRSFPWTKFQDFYLRLGFLKVLVGLLNPHRASVARETIIRRVGELTLTPARSKPELWTELVTKFPDFGDNADGAGDVQPRSLGGTPRTVTVAEALLLTGGGPSLCIDISPKTAFKVLDWGRDVGLIGPGNQITEAGLLLRHLLPEEDVRAFLTGAHGRWNPFVLEPRERLFFVLHLCEIDLLTMLLTRSLGHLEDDAVVGPEHANRLTCQAMFEFLGRVEGRVRPQELPAFRKARELAQAMASDLEMRELLPFGIVAPRQGPPRSVRTPWATTSSRSRRTTKNADHQAIPRFEQLTDLGFLRKRSEVGATGQQRRKDLARWQWLPTTTCRAWAKELESIWDKPEWHIGSFARMALSSGLVPSASEPLLPSGGEIAGYIWRAYQLVRRPAGHTPLRSVVQLATILAAGEGVPLEMNRQHEVVLQLKQQGQLPDTAFFAGGNDLDGMFVIFKEGFAAQFAEVLATMGLPSSASSS